jgi:hypothetical protein
MAFTQLKGLQAIGTEPRGDTIDEDGERGILLPVSFEIALRGIESLVTQDVQSQDLETIAGIEIIVHGLQALGEEGGDALRFPQRLGVPAEMRKTRPSTRKSTSSKDAAAGAAGFERGLQRSGDLAGELEDILFRTDGLDQTALGREAGDGQARRYRFLVRAKRLIQPQQQALAPKRRVSGARGVSIRSPTYFRPIFVRAATVSSARRSAATGSGASTVRRHPPR